MKKYISILFLATMFVACGPPEVTPGDGTISLNPSEYQMFVKDELRIEIITDLQGDLVWYSTNPDVAKIFYGNVTALALGETNIVAKIGKDSAICHIIVEGIPHVTPQKKSEKRGVGFNFSDRRDVEVLGQGISWYYTWGSSISDYMDGIITENNVMFLPMCWNGVDDGARTRIRALKAKHPEVEYILGFNEPNLTDQANMTPAACAPKWMQLVELAEELDMKLVSPAMNYGTLSGYSDPTKWLDEFFKLVPASSCAAIAIHCYMPNSGGVIGFVDMFRKYGKSIWMTEFCAWNGLGGGEKGQIAYASEVINFFESDPQVGKYAWFIPRGRENDAAFPHNKLLKFSGPELLPLGEVYVGASSQDKTSWANVGDRIEAERFSSCSLKEYVDKGYSGDILNFQYQPTTDKNGNLEISNFLMNRWVEYQIDIVDGGEYELLVRYANYYDATLEITIDGANAFDALLPKSGDPTIWQTAKFSVNLAAGKHTVRLKNKQSSGGINLNWLQFNKK